jgi:4-aminobutyrate aminotransferase/(S)-3-amino-2-methylpropionate transaminase
MASPDYFKLIHNLLDPIAPKGLSSVTFTRGGQGVEKAIITAMAERGQANWTAVGF